MVNRIFIWLFKEKFVERNPLLNQAYPQEYLFHMRKLWILSLSREFKKLKGAKDENVFHCIANGENRNIFFSI
tara:strand:+ start:313 stop:531 length:219 start_codon:yes stop_codon:yes gene_type:complete